MQMLCWRIRVWMKWLNRLQEDGKALDEMRCRKKIARGGGKRTAATDNGNIYDFSAFGSLEISHESSDESCEIWCSAFALNGEKYLTGRGRYASCNTHLRIEESQRDDLESLGYVLLYLFPGRTLELIRPDFRKDKYDQEGYKIKNVTFMQVQLYVGLDVVSDFQNKQHQSDVTTASDEPENRNVEEMKVGVTSPVCNLERFLESVTPSVTAQHPSKKRKFVETIFRRVAELVLEEGIYGRVFETLFNGTLVGLNTVFSVLSLGRRTTRGWRTSDVEHQPYFVLGDLWESFKEWSAYGAGVPLVLDGTDGVIQYYVPYLSGIQIYGDPLKSSVKSRQPTEYSDGDSFKDSSSDVSSDYDEHDRCSLHYSREKQDNHHPNGEISRRIDQLSLNDQHHVLQEGFSSDDGDSISTQGCLLFEYLERNQPWGREPLTDKILDLARRFPELKSLRSCDLLPSSWLSVAWYPIYRIPMGPTLKDLDACFLTFHSLHTPVTGIQCEHPSVVSYPNGKDDIPKVSLPVFGLASYKFKSPLWVHNDHTLVSSLLQVADNWLTMLQVNHPDYLFFSRGTVGFISFDMLNDKEGDMWEKDKTA
ncbi:hypothetical protein CTI12_AA524380 [Artemisia annua]|uniref:Uncharacterized protein n=1 Tax=Artemisia annua TaxID=35608 RepID=A0A2U1KY26_ARTAN|nr:hypothetical protein CTI12_AA524380 [Artemisia annua]